MNLNYDLIREYLASHTVFHGSREGIAGDIRPSSRQHCDFGRGFYMGTNAMQIKGLVSDAADPRVYQLELDLDPVPREKVVILDGMDWLYTVLGFRSSDLQLTGCRAIQLAVQRAAQADFVIGAIADDRMVRALDEFERGSLTDRALLACLADVDYGIQITAKTQLACGCIQIVEGRRLTAEEIAEARRFSVAKRAEGSDSIQRAQRKYRREGMYVDELIAALREGGTVLGQNENG